MKPDDEHPNDRFEMIEKCVKNDENTNCIGVDTDHCYGRDPKDWFYLADDVLDDACPPVGPKP